MKIPAATIALILVALATYLVVSEGNLYVSPPSKLWWLGVGSFNLAGVFTYSFMHIGFKHLLVNITIFFAIGWVAESRIGWKHTLGLFLFSSLLAGILYTVLAPTFWVIGSSAGVAGILVAAYLADVKKTVVVLIAAIAFATLIAIPLTDASVGYISSSHEKQLNKTSAKIVELNASIEEVREEIEEKQERGENVTLEIMEMENLTTLLNQTAIEKERAEVKKEAFQESVKKEEKTPPSNLIHMLGAVSGVAYMFIFKREAFDWFLHDLEGIWHFVRKRMKRKPREER